MKEVAIPYLKYDLNKCFNLTSGNGIEKMYKICLFSFIGCFEVSKKLKHNNIKKPFKYVGVTNITACKQLCKDSKECMSFNYFENQNGKCLLKSIKPEIGTRLALGDQAQYFGPKYCKGDSSTKFAFRLKIKIII